MARLSYLRVNNIGRGNNKSVVASAAYRAGETYTDELTNEVKNYKGKHHEVKFHSVFLPESAPIEHQNAGVLWNELQNLHSRYAKQFEIVFPYGLTHNERIFEKK